MARKSIEDVMNEIEDFLNSCSTKALSSNKVIVPRDEFDELFADLKVKIPAEIDRCKKIMRNKEAILMDARKNADVILAEAAAKAQEMVSETAIMAQANQTAYETVEMARVQANEMLAQAVSEANEIRLGSMQYTNDMMLGIRNYVEATMEAERANYENLIQTLNNDYMVVDANLTEIQNQIVEFTGNPNSVVKPPKMKTMKPIQTDKKLSEESKGKASMFDKVKQAVVGREEKEEQKKADTPNVNVPDFITNGETVVPGETSLEPTVLVDHKAETVKQEIAQQEMLATAVEEGNSTTQKVMPQTNMEKNISENSVKNTGETRKVTKKIVKKRTPVMHTPQTAQQTVAKTLEAAAASKVDKTVYKANGEQAREVTPMEGRVKRGPRVGRSVIDESIKGNAVDVATVQSDSSSKPVGKSMGVVDDFSMDEKF